MHDSNRTLIITLLVLLATVAIPSVYALKCYSCNTHPDYDGATCESGSIDEKHLINCDDAGKLHNRNYTMCRIFHQTVGTETRVVRSCATSGHDGCIARTGTFQIKLNYCECHGDGCNSADRKSRVGLALMTSSALIAVILSRFIWTLECSFLFFFVCLVTGLPPARPPVVCF